MTSTRSPIVVGLLAVALAASTIPFAPTASAATCETTDDTKIMSENGYVAVSHPRATNDRVSQALYFHVFGDSGAVPVLEGSLQRWTNGQDAYVIDFGCETDGNEQYCIERDKPEGNDEGDDVFLQQPLQDHPADVRVTLYTNSLSQVQDDDPTVPAADTGNEVCVSVSDSGARYAVIYLADGLPLGYQIDEMLFGPYTLDFHFELKRVV